MIELCLRSKGHELDVSEGSFGELRRSADVQTDFAALRDRFAEDGYLFIPGFFERAIFTRCGSKLPRGWRLRACWIRLPVIEAVKGRRGHDFPRRSGLPWTS